LRRLTLPIAAMLVLIAAGTAGGASKAGTLVFAGASDPTYLDPALVSDGESFRVTEQMFEGLVKLRPGTTKIVPSLATSWNLKGGKVWTFNLRKGVKFHDGTPWNAAAACANFNRWYNWTGPFQDPSATFYYQATYGGFKKNEVANLSPPLFKSCKTVGNYRIVVTLTKPSGVFFPSLVIQSFAMQSPTAMKKYGADEATLAGGAFRSTGSYAFQHPTGTGPFKFSSWTIGQKVELVKNKAYWGVKAKLDKIIIRPISNNQARFDALKTGEINAFDLAPPQDIDSLTSDSRLKVIKRPAFNVAYVTIHQGPGSPMNDIKVRQAVAYGLNRAAVVKNFYYGTGQVANEFQPPSLFGYSKNVQKYPYNPTKAKALLNSSACKVPCKIDFWYPTDVSRPYMPDPARNFQAFQASLEKSGFNVVAQARDGEDALKAIEETKPQVSIIDLRMPGMTGAKDLVRLRHQRPDVQLVVVSGSDSREDILQAMSAGAHGYIIKSQHTDKLIDRLRYILSGEIYVPPILAELPAPDVAQRVSKKLSSRQLQVLKGLVEGKSNKEIAKGLNVAEGTVKMHLAALYRVLGATNRAHAAALGKQLIG
jgi:peptide/nickel transport system substrate-binding protein